MTTACVARRITPGAATRVSLILRQELASFRLLFHPPTVETPRLVATTRTSPPAGVVARAQAPRYIDALTADADADVVLGADDEGLGADDADYSGADDADYSGADDAGLGASGGGGRGGGSSSYPNGAKPLHATHINEHISMPDDHNGDADLAVHDAA